MLDDFRYALRNLIKNRGYAVVIIITLALAIGGSTAVFSVVNGVLIRPLPYKSPDGLVMVWNRYGKLKESRAHVSPPDFMDRKRDSRTLESMAAIEESSLNLIGRGEPERIRTAKVSSSLFPLLGVSPSYGRNFTEEEDQPGKNSVVIVSHNLWKRRFGSESALIGKTLNLSGNQCEVIGIMPASFWFPTPDFDLWMPIAFTPEQLSNDNRGSEYLSMIARVKPGVSESQVHAEMNTIAARVLQRAPERAEFLTNAGWGAIVVPLRKSIIGDVEPALLVLMGAVSFLLSIGCANVANLILSRTGGREKEIAIRAVLGADRISLVRLLFVESLLLAIAGGMIGLLLAYWSTMLLPAIAPETLPRLSEIAIDGTVLTFSFVVSLLAGAMIGIVPAMRVSLFHPYQSLKLEGTSTPPKSIHRFRSILVILEIAMALVLATGAALLMKSFGRLISIDPGFQTRNRLTFTLALPPAQYQDESRTINFYQQLRHEIERLPGVQSAGANASLPIANHNWTATFSVQDKPIQPGEPAYGFEYRFVTPNYFRAMGMPFRSGRDFSDRDTTETTRVAIIDVNLANLFWPNQNPLGKRIAFGNSPRSARWREVVGIVGHVKNAGLKEEGGEQIYFPHSQIGELTMSFVIHATSDTTALIGLIRSRIKSLDPNLPIYQITTMDQILSGSIAQPRFTMLLFVLFATTALALSAVGIYGVLSYSVTQRRKEIGIRMALGAKRENILMMILRQSLLLACAGLITGTLASLALSRYLAGLLFKLEPVDPMIYAATAGIAMIVALLATSLPAKRAASIDPLFTLRGE
ncbi:ABC transporter permease [bacterium]|nr:ABC transporter permease [bacterium]